MGLIQRTMTGRDPHEPHRASTPLELLFDLCVAVAVGQGRANSTKGSAPITSAMQSPGSSWRSSRFGGRG